MKIKYCALWLSALCIMVFILQIAFPGLSNLFVLDSGKAAEIWRFLTAIFLHGSMGHLLSNLFALALFGTILENFIGSRKFLIIFFASGIFANIIAINFYPLSLGASGAIYGILGALVVIRPLMMIWVYGMPMPLFIAGIVWVVGGVLGLFYPSDVGHIAHLSGIAVGFVLGLLWRNWRREPEMHKIIIDDNLIKRWEEDYIEQ